MESSDRQSLIKKCLEQRCSCAEANDILRRNNYSPMLNGEADCYDVLWLNFKIRNPKQQVIADCLIKGLTRTDANLRLYDNQMRCMTQEENTKYDEIYSKMRLCGKFHNEVSHTVNNNSNKNSNILSFEEIFQNGIANKSSAEEVNKNLIKYGYSAMSREQEADYLKQYNKFYNSRQSIIRSAYEEYKTVPEVNKILYEQGLSPLSWFEEMEYQKDRANMSNKKRLDIIKECIEEQMTRGEINSVLEKYGFEWLTEQETKDIEMKQKNVAESRQSQKSADLSEQFRQLYRTAVKKYHPDKYNDAEKKALATSRIKELNIAKDRKDYFLLKETVEKFCKEDEEQN